MSHMYDDFVFNYDEKTIQRILKNDIKDILKENEISCYLDTLESIFKSARKFF